MKLSKLHTKTAILPALLLAAALCGGCREEEPIPDVGAPPAYAETAPTQAETNQVSPPENDGAIHVHTAEELLLAIAPGAEIVVDMEQCRLSDFTAEFDISFAVSDQMNEEWEKKQPYVRFEYASDGMEVVIHDLDGLTLRSKNGAELVTAATYADVLRFERCTGIRLEKLTLGHDTASDCGGNVLGFVDCSDITLEELDLYGCGVYGVFANGCAGLTMRHSTIRDCSDGLLSLGGCANFLFESCTMRDSGSYSAIDAFESAVRFDGCTFKGNDERGSFIRDNTGNSLRFQNCVFGPWEAGEILMYRENSAGLVLGQSNESDYSDILLSVEVGTVEELFESIAPNRTILLRPGRYELSSWLRETWEREGSAWNNTHPYVRIEECFDGVEAVCHHLKGVTIASSTGNSADVELVAEPRYACVLSFKSCDAVTLADFTAGHSQGGSCEGDVVRLDNCRNAVFSGLDLYGCGVWGIHASRVDSLRVLNSVIRDCSDGAVQLEDCEGRMSFSGCSFFGSDGGFLFFDTEYADISFYHCSFGEKESNSLYFRGDVSLEDCLWSDITEYPDIQPPEDLPVG